MPAKRMIDMARQPRFIVERTSEPCAKSTTLLAVTRTKNTEIIAWYKARAAKRHATLPASQYARTFADFSVCFDQR